jgi:hypothetical protein
VSNTQRRTPDESAFGKQVIYYHIQLPDYATDTLVTNGLTTESLNDGKYSESYEWGRVERGYKRVLRLPQRD